MPIVVKIWLKRGLESNRKNYVPDPGEALWTLDDKRFYIGDGSTAGGVQPRYTIPELYDTLINIGVPYLFDDTSAAQYIHWEEDIKKWVNSYIRPEDLPYGIPAQKIGIGNVDNTEFSYLDNARSNIQIQLDDKSSISGTTQQKFQIRQTFGVILKDGDPFPPTCDNILELRNYNDTDYACLRVKNLYVEGTEFILDVENLSSKDPFIILNSDSSGYPYQDAGIIVERGSEPPAVIIWNESINIWQIGLSGFECDIVDVCTTQIIYNKTLVQPIILTPTIYDFSLAIHDHESDLGGGQIDDDAFRIPVRTHKGGTGQDSSTWNGFARIVNGIWMPSGISGGDITPGSISHNDLTDVTPNQHHNQIHDIQGDDHYGVLEANKGGTGLSGTIPGYILIGNDLSTWTHAPLTAGDFISINSESGSITITGSVGYYQVRHDLDPIVTERHILNFSGPGFEVSDDDPNTKINLTYDLQSLAYLYSNEGFLVRRYNGTSFEFVFRRLVAGTGIAITYPWGVSGNPIISATGECEVCQSGYSGVSGFSGPQGESGIDGLDGSSGVSGYSGLSGFSGYSGSGFSGYTGVSGFSGYTGISGISGFSGQEGAFTASGFSGYTGISGFSGYTGVSGFSGYTGVSGVSGFSGYTGVSGVSGFSGYTGISGFSGLDGIASASGFSGYSSSVSGASGFSGFSGKSGWEFTILCKDSNYTANASELILCDTSSGGFTITLPPSPVAGDRVRVVDDLGTFATNNLTVDRNGNTILGVAGNLIADRDNCFLEFLFDCSLSDWNVDIGGAIENLSTLGVSGFSGYTGSSGFSGFSGYTGTSGFSGFSGYCGIQGESGIDGVDGASGFSGFSGSGFSGYTGVSGFSGFSGYTGVSGISGFSGYSGVSGWEFSVTCRDSNYTASASELVLCDTSSGGFTITLPSSPSSGDRVRVVDDLGTFATNNLTINRNGNTILGVAGNLIADRDNCFLEFLFDCSLSDWNVDIGGAIENLSTLGVSGFSGYSGKSGFSGYTGLSGKSGFSGYTGVSGISGFSGYIGVSGKSGFSGYTGISGKSGYSSSVTGPTGSSGTSGKSGFSGFSASFTGYWTRDSINGELYPNVITDQIGLGTTDPESLLELSSSASWLTLHNPNETDSDGDRRTRIRFKGEQSGGEETTLGIIEASHDGSVDDEKGKFTFYTNAFSDGDVPTLGMVLDSDQHLTIKTSDTTEILNVGGALSMEEISTPVTTLNYGKIYANSTDSHLYYVKDDGSNICLSKGITSTITVVENLSLSCSRNAYGLENIVITVSKRTYTVTDGNVTASGSLVNSNIDTSALC